MSTMEPLVSRGFSNLLRRCTEDGVNSVLGDNGMRLLIFHIPELDRHWDDPNECQECLYTFFGEGARTLEKAIVKELFRRLDEDYPGDDKFDFKRYVGLAREIFARELRCSLTRT